MGRREYINFFIHHPCMYQLLTHWLASSHLYLIQQFVTYWPCRQSDDCIILGSCVVCYGICLQTSNLLIGDTGSRCLVSRLWNSLYRTVTTFHLGFEAAQVSRVISIRDTAPHETMKTKYWTLLYRNIGGRTTAFKGQTQINQNNIPYHRHAAYPLLTWYRGNYFPHCTVHQVLKISYQQHP